MPLYRYSIEPLSAFATPLRSDTLYGHLLWAAAQKRGQEAVEKLIREFDSPSPPFRLSSAFPAGFLPMPVLPAMSRRRFREKYGREGDEAGLVEHLTHYKAFRKKRWLPLSLWRRCRDKMSQERLFQRYLERKDIFDPRPPASRRGKGPEAGPRESSKDWFQPHNSIDRRSGTVLEQGGLFFVPVTFYHPGGKLHLYLEGERPGLFEELLDFVAQTGFGADAGTGKGHFRWQRDRDFDPGQVAGRGSWRLNLSVCSRPDLGGFEGFYAPFVKLGKAWSGFGERNPFKKPFLAFSEGSVFRAMPPGPYLLRGIHSNPQVVQVTWPLTLALELEDAS